MRYLNSFFTFWIPHNHQMCLQSFMKTNFIILFVFALLQFMMFCYPPSPYPALIVSTLHNNLHCMRNVFDKQLFKMCTFIKHFATMQTTFLPRVRAFIPPS